MRRSETKNLPEAYDVLAPDGSEVRVLLALDRGGMAHFLLPPGRVSKPVRHRTVEEIWFVLSGEGEIWRSDTGVVKLTAGICLTIPLGVSFQFRAIGTEPLAIVGVTMPPWPGPNEAEFVAGFWPTPD